MNKEKKEIEEKILNKFTRLKFGDGSPQGGGKGVYRVIKESVNIEDVIDECLSYLDPYANKKIKESYLKGIKVGREQYRHR